ncbi:MULTISPECIES: hypothetical protein [unclassified Streptomyces]|uniref:hypothetical protein n=1 Tax=unclassified Streptomyces TaxID=2593676 RepID=UPI00342C6741
MAHTDHSDRTPQRTPHGTLRTARRGLRREVPSTVGLLADERDFTAMRRYRTFTFDDHAAYLRGIDGLLKSLASQGVHTTVALFDPEEYAEYCAESGLDPDTADSRGRFTARIPGSGAAIAYTGQPIDSLVPQLISTAVRRATWEYATTLLADLGECADCGQDIGRAAFDRASHLLLRLLEGAGSGTHHLVCSVPAVDERLLAVLRTERPDSSPDGPDSSPDGPDNSSEDSPDNSPDNSPGGPGGAPARLDASQATEFVTVLAVGIALESAGGVVLRTTRADDPDRLHGWRLQRGSLVPLTAGEVFSAYCTDADTGEPVSPESGVEYCPGFDLGPDDTGTHH